MTGAAHPVPDLDRKVFNGKPYIPLSGPRCRIVSPSLTNLRYTIRPNLDAVEPTRTLIHAHTHTHTRIYTHTHTHTHTQTDTQTLYTEPRARAHARTYSHGSRLHLQAQAEVEKWALLF